MICPACGHQNRDTNQYCTQCGAQIAGTPQRAGHLIVVSEPLLPQKQRRQSGDETRTGAERRKGVPITGQAFTLGRHTDNDFIINDAQASAHHARITTDGQEFWMEDLGSTNGTYVDGVRLQDRIRLLPESLIKIGSTIVKFAVQSPGTPGRAGA